jgi:SAM-dependent methyltransferase
VQVNDTRRWYPIDGHPRRRINLFTVSATKGDAGHVTPQQAMARRVFDRLFPAEPRQRVAFHQEVVARLPATGRVLDVGCGTNLELAGYRTAQREVWGVDFQAHPQLSHTEWFRLLDPDGTIPFPAGHFDIVAACWVLEHVREPRRFVAEVERVLRPGGCLIALTVSGHHYVTWIARAARLLPEGVVQRLVRRLYARDARDRFPAYYRMNTIGQLATACAGTSLSVEGNARFADQGYFGFSNAARTMATVCDWSLEQIAPGWGRIYLTVVCRKSDGPSRPGVTQQSL